jgi:hypothetical protein
MCRMRGRKVRNEQDARGKLAQKFAHRCNVRTGAVINTIPVG